MNLRVIDANIILRFVTGDHPTMSPRCRELFARVQSKTETVFLPEAALSDVVWTLKSFYKWPHDQIHRFVSTLLNLEGVRMYRKIVVWQALTLFNNNNVDFSDALIVAEMYQANLEEIYTYDSDFDKFSAIVRIEP